MFPDMQSGIHFRLAMQNGKVSNNPVRATQHQREDNSRVRYLSAEEETRLRAILIGRWSEHIPVLDLALHTGLRRGEMFGLEWPDVDVTGRCLHVRRGKNGEGRYVHLNSVALQALGELRRRSPSATGPVIRNLAGEPLHGSRYWFDPALELAGIENFHWHDLRHTFASRLAMAGVGLAAIQRALGHKSVAMTMRYAHLTEAFMLEAVEKLVPASDGTARAARTDTRTDTGHAMETEVKPALVH